MRKLTVRERILLACLGAVAVICGYVLFFYLPLTQKTAALEAQITQGEALSAQLEEKLAQQRQMERQLEAPEEDAPPRMPDYDNLQAVLQELHTVLADCGEYSLSFQGSALEDGVYCRYVTMPFTCGSYTEAREVLRRLQDSGLRCLLEEIQVLEQEDGSVRVTAAVTFLEYQGAA